MDFRTLIWPYAVRDVTSSDEAKERWMDNLTGVLETVSTGHFINEADLPLHPSRAAGSFSPKSFTGYRTCERNQIRRAYFSPIQAEGQ